MATHYENSPPFDENEDLYAEKLAGGFFKGILKISAMALMAVIAGYSAGIAQEHYRQSRSRAYGSSDRQ